MQRESLGTGRRKTAVARVRLRAGSGQVVINGRPFEEYFQNAQERLDVMASLLAVGKETQVDIRAKCNGGGISGQANALKLGIARALMQFEAELEPVLRQNHLLTRDSRMKERKHYGLRGARRGTQFSKR